MNWNVRPAKWMTSAAELAKGYFPIWQTRRNSITQLKDTKDKQYDWRIVQMAPTKLQKALRGYIKFKINTWISYLIRLCSKMTSYLLKSPQQESKSHAETNITLHLSNNHCCAGALPALTCVSDIDECTTGSHNCSLAETCYNIQGGHRCLSLDCPPNYRKVSDTYVWDTPPWLTNVVQKGGGGSIANLPSACRCESEVFVCLLAINWRPVQAAFAPRRLGRIPAACSLECISGNTKMDGWLKWLKLLLIMILNVFCMRTPRPAGRLLFFFLFVWHTLSQVWEDCYRVWIT